MPKFTLRSDGAAARARIQDVAFWDRVAKGKPDWLWTGSLNADGYGVIGRSGQYMRVHRYAWFLATGDLLTDDNTICHVCDIPNCVRSDDEGTYRVGTNVYPRRGHLYKATQPANVADRDAKERGHWATGSQHGTHTKPERVPRGERSGNAKLTEPDVREILAGNNGRRGYPSAMSRQYDVSLPLIRGILNGDGWQHIDRATIHQQPNATAFYDCWTKHPNGCVDCGSKSQRHVGHGLCQRCYMRERMRAKRAAGYIAPSRRK